MINPTGRKIRSDNQGDGHHGAPRGKRIHDGVDFECVPGQFVLAPHDGVLKRVAYPYSGNRMWKGCVLASVEITTKMFYVDVHKNSIGSTVKAGAPIGKAQDISQKYPGMTPHIHLRVTNVDPLLLIDVA